MRRLVLLSVALLVIAGCNDALGPTVYYYSVDRVGNFGTPRQVVANDGSIGTTSEPMDRN